MSSHIASQISKPTLRSDNTLHVIGVISNPEMYHSRYRLAREWIERMKATPNVQLHIVEAAFGDREHEIVHDDSVLQLRTKTSAWVKENMINLGVRHLLPADWRYVAWIDADVEFRNPNWAQDTLHQLQHFHVVQPWQHAADLGPHGSIMQTHTSFGYLLQQGVRMQKWSGEPYPYGHSGFAWACTRTFWEQVEGLIDCCILGSADHHMAWAMRGQAKSTIHGKMHPAFFRRIQEWQDKAMRITHGEVGFTVGRIEHHFHGKKADRKYRERWQILVDNDFNPDTDLQRDAQGLYHIVGKPQLEADIRRYNRARNEDSVDAT